VPTELALEGPGVFILSGQTAGLDGALHTRRDEMARCGQP
jgi:hypothetical protein